MAQEKQWTKEEIKGLLEKNDKAVLRALVVIYSLQTQDEQRSEETKENNGVGFNGADAQILTGFAKQVIKYNTLSVKQMIVARKKIMKYSKQLAMVSNGKIKVNVITDAA